MCAIRDGYAIAHMTLTESKYWTSRQETDRVGLMTKLTKSKRAFKTCSSISPMAILFSYAMIRKRPLLLLVGIF